LTFILIPLWVVVPWKESLFYGERLGCVVLERGSRPKRFETSQISVSRSNLIVIPSVLDSDKMITMTTDVKANSNQGRAGLVF
jgi:hypothetical protein